MSESFPIDILETFLNFPVVVKTPLSEVAGVLARADHSQHGGIGSLLIYSFAGSWVLVKSWTALKSAHSST